MLFSSRFLGKKKKSVRKSALVGSGACKNLSVSNLSMRGFEIGNMMIEDLLFDR